MLVSQGPALESVIAAASIPGVFPPVRIGELRLVDGGVVNNTPISHAVELVVLAAPNAGGVRPTCFEHLDRLMQGARVAARATLASQTVETPLRLVG